MTFNLHILSDLKYIFHQNIVAIHCVDSVQIVLIVKLIKYLFFDLPSSPHSHPIFVFHFHNPQESFIQTLTNHGGDPT